MPKQDEVFAVNNFDKETALAISYQALKDLKWDILFAGEEKLLGQTIKKWNANPQHVVISYKGSELSVSSEMIKDELLDITGKNRKNIAAFFAAFETAKNNISADTIKANKAAITDLRLLTAAAAEQEQKDAEEIDQAMNLSGSNIYVTYSIIAINVLVFILMIVNGAGLFEPNGYVHIKWGSDYAPLTLSGDWWRLITNVFIHFGIIHLAMNMYCLYTAGVYLEPMLGKVKYTAAYLCTGILASVVSLWWHKEPVNSAGASGAVFGLYGLFLALLTTNLIPKHFRKSLLPSIGLFIVFNLFYGIKGGVDNAAHVGGLISGFTIGYIFVLGIKKEKEQQKIPWITPLILAFTLLSTFAYLQLHKVSPQTRLATLNIIAGASFKDYDKYNEKMNQVSLKEEAALGALKGADSITKEEFVSRLNQAILIWDTVTQLVKSTTNYMISEANHKRTEKLLEYVQLRKKQYDLLIMLNSNSVNNEENVNNKELQETSEKISKIVDELNTL
jgi:rhomboid protease GluP